MTIAITGLRASPWQSLAGYIKQLERSCRRWQLINCSNCFTRVTTLSTCTLGVDTGVESESPPFRRVFILSHLASVILFNYNCRSFQTSTSLSIASRKVVNIGSRKRVLLFL